MNRILTAVAAFFLNCFILHAQIPPGAAAAYPFCGNANDMTGSNHGLVIGAGLTTDRFGNPNQAYYFNGQPNCYINLGTSDTLKPVKGSISVWARPDGFSSMGSGYLFNPIILTKNQPGNNCYEGYTIGLANVNSQFQFHGVLTQPICNQSISRYNGVIYQSWYHIVLAWDLDSTKLYVNGTLQDAVAKGFNTTYLSGDSVMVGNSANVQNNRFFLGAIDDLYIYPHELNPTEVQALYTSTWDCTAGLPDQETELQLSLFPNPVTSGYIQISGLPDGARGTICIYSVNGSLIFNGRASAVIEIAELEAGVYFLHYADDNAYAVSKFICVKQP